MEKLKRYKGKLKESSWSRIIQHIEDGVYSFAVISAYLKDLTVEENLKRHEDLRKDIRNLGYGYIEQKSGYTYKDDETETTVEEKSFFIPLINREEALRLCNKYNQYSILFKDDSSFYEIRSDGKIETRFKTKRDSKTGQITFDPKILKIAYSKLKKSSQYQRGQKFSYVIKECIWIKEYRIPSWAEAMGSKEIPKVEYIRII